MLDVMVEFVLFNDYSDNCAVCAANSVSKIPEQSSECCCHYSYLRGQGSGLGPLELRIQAPQGGQFINRLAE